MVSAWIVPAVAVTVSGFSLPGFSSPLLLQLPGSLSVPLGVRSAESSLLNVGLTSQFKLAFSSFCS